MFQEKGISMEIVRKLTLLVHKATEVLDSQDPLRQTLRRDSVTFFSHLDLCDKGTKELDIPKVCACAASIAGYLELLENHKACARVKVGMLAKLYLKIAERLRTNKSSRSAPERKQPETSRGDIGIFMPKTTIRTESKPSFVASVATRSELTERQRFMLAFASKNKSFQLKDLSIHFPSLSEKTIRNDLVVLCEQRCLERRGVPPRSYYQFVHGAEASGIYAEKIAPYAEAIPVNAEFSIGV